MTYEYEVRGEEVDFEPIEASDIHAAAREVRRILALRSVWGVEEPFTATVTIRSTDGAATVNMPVECNSQVMEKTCTCNKCGKTLSNFEGRTAGCQHASCGGIFVADQPFDE